MTAVLINYDALIMTRSYITYGWVGKLPVGTKLALSALCRKNTPTPAVNIS